LGALAPRAKALGGTCSADNRVRERTHFGESTALETSLLGSARVCGLRVTVS